jgi:hypothetical protein
LTVDIKTNVDQGTIFFTTDGSEPSEVDDEDELYTGSLEIAQTTRLRARVFDADGEPGPVGSAVYIEIDPDLTTFSSNLPLVIVDSFGLDIDEQWDPEEPRPFRPVSAVLIDTDDISGRASILGVPDYAGPGGMHVRGSSTAEYDKKQYRLETWDEHDEDLDAALLGLPDESDWILHAPYSDKTLMRNFSMYTWSNAIGRYAARTVFVELFYSADGAAVTMDDYRGVYVLMEKIKRDKHRVDIAKMGPQDNAEPAVSGGYLLRKDWWDWQTEEQGYDPGFETEIYGDEIQYIHPQPENITGPQSDWIKDHFDQLEEVLAGDGFTDPETGYAAFIDRGSFIDHMLLVEMARNVDGYVLSTYLFKDRGGKVNMGPIWDYNGALGNADYFCAWEPAGWHYLFDGADCGQGGESFPADNENAFKWYERLLEDPAFITARTERWADLRQGPLATDKLLDDIDANAALLAEAAERNFERWEILGEYVWPNDEGCEDRHSFEEEITYLKDWLTARLEWLDGAA